MNDNKKTDIVLFCLGGIVVIWLSLLIAPYINGGLVEIINNLPQKMNTPFEIEFCKNSIKTILIFIFVYLLGVGVYLSTRRNYRRGKEYGSAIWGNAKQINKKYMQLPKSQNKILTQNVMLGLNARKHKRNLNVLVIGGSGAGKTRFYAKPNIMQCNCSYVILDPKGEILRDTRTIIRKARLQNKSIRFSKYRKKPLL